MPKMILNLGAALDLTATGAQPAVEVGETPFFPGANAIIHLSAPVGGAGVLTLQGQDEPGGAWRDLRTFVAANGTVGELDDLPAHAVRVNITTAGTGTLAQIALEGVQ